MKIETVMIGILLLIAGWDWKTKKIPLYLLLVYAFLGCIVWQDTPEIISDSQPAGLLAVSVPMCIMNRARPSSWGRGDIFLAAITGAFMGWRHVLLAAYLAVVGGGMYGSFLLIARRKPGNWQIAFSPFWALGVSIVLLWGSEILSWYSNFLP